MTILQAAMAALAIQAGAVGWTWTLYEGDGPLVLANEIPDTPELRTTVECDAGSGVARVSVYGEPMAAGFANVSSGDASATAQTEASRGGKTSLAVRADHPVFTHFVSVGTLTLAVGDQSRIIEVPRAHMAKLRRFAELCGA